MGSVTSIEWTTTHNPDGTVTPGSTWNPVTGCSPCSTGCARCYAKAIATRFAGTKAHPNGFKVTLHPERLDMPLRWKKPRKIFVNSMSDLFHEDVPEEFISQIFETMILAPRHTYQVLTKRPERMLELTNRWRVFVGSVRHLWLGVTTENQEMADWRIPRLLQTPAAVRFVSMEPLLGKVDLHLRRREPCSPTCFHHVTHPCEKCGYQAGRLPIGWVIAGAETGPGKRPMDLDWARSLRDQCAEAGVAFFFKKDSNGNHELDGRVHEEFPCVSGSAESA